jgi:hypothetical protein
MTSAQGEVLHTDITLFDDGEGPIVIEHVGTTGQQKNYGARVKQAIYAAVRDVKLVEYRGEKMFITLYPKQDRDKAIAALREVPPQQPRRPQGTPKTLDDMAPGSLERGPATKKRSRNRL